MAEDQAGESPRPDRRALRKAFRTAGPALLPVIPVRDAEGALANAGAAIRAGAPGLFLVNRELEPARLVPVIFRLRRAYPTLWFGVNFAGQPARVAFAVLGRLRSEGCTVDACLADDAGIEPGAKAQPALDRDEEVRAKSGWQGLYLGGVALARDRPLAAPDLPRAAMAARDRIDVVATGGAEAGAQATRAKIVVFRRALGERPLALAGAFTPESAERLAPHVDLMLATEGLARPGAAHELDPDRLTGVLARLREVGAVPAAAEERA